MKIIISSILLVLFTMNKLVDSQDMNMNDVIKEQGYLEIKDRSKLTAGADSLRIKIPPKGNGEKPEFKYRVQAVRGRPSVEISIEPDAPVAVGESLDWSKASDINKGQKAFIKPGK